MHGIEHGTYVIYLLTILLLAPVLYYIVKARKRKDLYVRRIAGIDAVDEAIGRAAELGKPMFFTTGITGLGPVFYACLGVLHHIAKKAAIFKHRLVLPQSNPEVMVIVEDVVRDAYQSQGRLSYFNPGTVQYLSDEQFAFAAGYMGNIQREDAAAAFLFGSFAAESLILAEAGQQIGAMQVGATVSPEQVAFFITTCDYTLIGEELYAASAYLSRESVQMGSLYGQDRAKLVIMLIIIIGVILATLQSIAPGLISQDFNFYHFWLLGNE